MTVAVKKINGITRLATHKILGKQLSEEFFNNLLLSDVNCKGYYRFEGNSNDTKNAHNGTDSNVSYNASYGKYGQGVSFNATTSYITVASHADNTNIFASGGSVSVWIYAKSLGEGSLARVYDKSADSTMGTTIYMGSASGTNYTIRFGTIWDALAQWATTNYDVPQNTWTHVVVTYNSSSTANAPIIYINGASKSITQMNAPSGTFKSDASATLFIGNRNLNDRTWDGYIDELIFFNDILTSTEVLAIYNTQIKKFMGVSNV